MKMRRINKLLLIILFLIHLLDNCRASKRVSYESNRSTTEVREDSLEIDYNSSKVENRQKVIEIYDTIGRVVRKEVELIEEEGITNILNRQITLEGTNTTDTITRVEVIEREGFKIDYKRLNNSILLMFLTVLLYISYRIFIKFK